MIVAGRLQQHVAEPYPQFCYTYLLSAKAAFDKECSLYHDFTPPKNKVQRKSAPDASTATPRPSRSGFAASKDIPTSKDSIFVWSQRS